LAFVDRGGFHRSQQLCFERGIGREGAVYEAFLMVFRTGDEALSSPVGYAALPRFSCAT